MSFFISKNNKDMLLVKIFLIRQCCKTKTVTSQNLILVQKQPVIGCFSLSGSANTVKLNNNACFEKKVQSVQLLVDREGAGFP